MATKRIKRMKRRTSKGGTTTHSNTFNLSKEVRNQGPKQLSIKKAVDLMNTSYHNYSLDEIEKFAKHSQAINEIYFYLSTIHLVDNPRYHFIKSLIEDKTNNSREAQLFRAAHDIAYLHNQNHNNIFV